MSDSQKTDWQSSQNDELDRLLDAALAKYAAVEPRPGLEERVLANLNAERPQLGRFWWRWGLAGALAVVLIMAAALAWKSYVPSKPIIANHSAETAPLPPTQAPQVAHNNAKRQTTRAVHKVAHLEPVAGPKLDVFPSPQPLSEEELALARYVQDFPSDAKLVAQAQEASAREIMSKMQALANESTESN